MNAYLRSLGRRLSAAALLLATVACEDATAPVAASVVAVADDVTIGVGDTLRLTASMRVGDRIVRDAPLQWRTLDGTIATIDASTGLVSARQPGVARLVVASGALEDTVRLTITNAVASLTLSLGSDSGFVGGALQATVVARDAAGNVIPRPALLWQTSDSTVAIPAASGVVATWAEGTARIRVTSGTRTSEVPVHVRFARQSLGGLAVRQLSMGRDFGCLLDGGGQAYCFGRQVVGRLGRSGLTSGSTQPIRLVETDQRFVQLEAQSGTACGRTAGNRLFCWGQNAIPRNSPLPVAVLDSIPTQDFSIGPHEATCALATDGVLRCWGHNDFYQLGRGPLRGYDTLPAPVTGADLRFRDVAIGYLHGCGVHVDGRAWCWGGINDARYATEDVPRDPPAPVPAGPALVQVTSAGGVFLFASCGLTAEGEAWCWGTIRPGCTGPVRPAPRRRGERRSASRRTVVSCASTPVSSTCAASRATARCGAGASRRSSAWRGNCTGARRYASRPGTGSSRSPRRISGPAACARMT